MGRLAWVVVLVAGCATTPKWQSATTMAEEKFPPRAELQQVALRPAKLDTAKHDTVAVDSWSLEGPFPSEATVTPIPPSTPWELELAKAVPALGKVLTADQQCIAREVALFWLAHQSYPGNSLQAFIERRCGTTAPQVRLSSLSGEIPETTTDAEWLEHWKANLATQAQGLGTPDVAGIAVRRDGKRGVMVIAIAQLGARYTAPLPLVGTSGSIVLRGRLATGGADRIDALINKGPHGVAQCKALEVLSPPEFAIECPVDAADDRTTLELVAYDPGRMLGRRVASLLLWPKGAPVNLWQRPGGHVDVAAGEFDTQFLAAVNAMRATALLPLLSLAKQQSATASLLAPHYFSAAFGEGDPVDSDRVALGMMAGWDVGLDIVSSGFGSQWLSGTRDLSVFLEFVIDSPYTRQSITDPRATHLAVGSVANVTSSLAAIFATYVPLGTFDRKESETAVITRLNQERLDHKLRLAQWTLWPSDEGEVVALNLAAKRWDPNDALQHVLGKSAEVSRGRVSGYVQLVDDLKTFKFPPEVLTRPDINVFISVAVYRGEAWAQSRYVVCLVIANAHDIETASR
jgi:hypothetical protein